nr:hypothetical protein Iba_chr03aCG15010 [Ipomoea batatas]GMC74781.1 hypothetical protein Iba_chr03cCG13320 [Ipomoea batatas]GME13046.1 hypothetical protein Iba_scaffold14336CG0300 [Ipomoea batatas]
MRVAMAVLIARPFRLEGAVTIPTVSVTTLPMRSIVITRKIPFLIAAILVALLSQPTLTPALEPVSIHQLARAHQS